MVHNGAGPGGLDGRKVCPFGAEYGADDFWLRPLWRRPLW
jgi:hypothetical protein